MDEEIGNKMGMVYQVYFQTERSKTESQVREAVAAGVQYASIPFPTYSLPVYPSSPANRIPGLCF